MSRMEELVKSHEKLRRSGINLIASENMLSPKVAAALSSDLAGRYHSYWYGGTKIAGEITQETEALARQVFGVKYAQVTSLSGNMCDLAVLFAYTKPGDSVAMMTLDCGGYPLGVTKFQRKLVPLPAMEGTFELDTKKSIDLIIENNVKLAILGASYIPFPHPVREISEGVGNSATWVYDGSHVLGLMACGKFQSPLNEGAEVLIGSTHKSLFGPQGGLVLTNSKVHDEILRNMLGFDVDAGIGLVDNPHMNRIAALGLALEEIAADPGYGERVIANAKALGKILDDLGVPVKFRDRDYTQSHQIFLDMDDETARSFCRTLEEFGVFIDIAGRIGVAEATHRGMEESDFEFIAHVISDVYKGKIESDLRSKISDFAGRF